MAVEPVNQNSLQEITGLFVCLLLLFFTWELFPFMILKKKDQNCFTSNKYFHLQTIMSLPDRSSLTQQVVPPKAPQLLRNIQGVELAKRQYHWASLGWTKASFIKPWHLHQHDLKVLLAWHHRIQWNHNELRKKRKSYTFSILECRDSFVQTALAVDDVSTIFAQIYTRILDSSAGKQGEKRNDKHLFCHHL